MRRESCAICGSAMLTTILDLGTSPLADAFPEDAAEQTRYPLDLLQCQTCALVQLGEIVDDNLLFGSDYAFFSGASPSLVDTYDELAHWLLREHAAECAQGVIEIASNDGTLLHHFQTAGHSVLGIDPALPAATRALSRGVPTRVRAFSSREAESVVALDHGTHFGRQAGLVIANHVLAHVTDPVDFMQGIATLLHPDGLALIEVQYFFDLFFGNEWDHVYHEHRTYLCLTDVVRLANQVGLVVTEVDNSPAQGGSIRVQLRHRGEPSDRVLRVLNREMGFNDYGGWQARVDYSRERILDLLWSFKRQGKRIAGYGASAKSTTLLNYCDIDANLLDCVVDATAYKIGRLTPGSLIPIVSAEPNVDVYLLLVWNYLAGVLRRERAFRERGGLFLVPIPHPVVL